MRVLIIDGVGVHNGGGGGVCAIHEQQIVNNNYYEIKFLLANVKLSLVSPIPKLRAAKAYVQTRV